MKLVHPEMQYQIDLSEGSITAIFFDSPNILRKWILELIGQWHGEAGLFVLSEDGDELRLANSLTIITDPLSFDINDKRLSSKVQSLLKAFVVSSEIFEQTQSILSSLEKYGAQIQESFAYPVAYEETDPSALIKALSFRLDFDYQDEIERLLEYMNMMHDICGISAFVILGAFSLFSLEEIKALCNDCKLHGHSVLFIEGASSLVESEMDFLNKVVIDADGCELF